mgnify:CR=1 FL=1
MTSLVGPVRWNGFCACDITFAVRFSCPVWARTCGFRPQHLYCPSTVKSSTLRSCPAFLDDASILFSMSCFLVRPKHGQPLALWSVEWHLEQDRFALVVTSLNRNVSFPLDGLTLPVYPHSVCSCPEPPRVTSPHWMLVICRVAGKGHPISIIFSMRLSWIAGDIVPFQKPESSWQGSWRVVTPFHFLCVNALINLWRVHMSFRYWLIRISQSLSSSPSCWINHRAVLPALTLCLLSDINRMLMAVC